MGKTERRLDWAGKASTIIFVAVLAFAAASVLFKVLDGNAEPFEPLSVSDVTINSRVAGFDGPAVLAGEHYNGTLTICNSGDEALTITFVIQLERLTEPIHFVSLGSIEFPVEPGCMTATGDSAPLTEEITPGRWRESSSAIVQRGDQKQTVAFVSDPFEVLP